MHFLSSLPQNCLGFIFPVNILYSKDNVIDLASKGLILVSPVEVISSCSSIYPPFSQHPWSQWFRSERSLAQVKDGFHRHGRKLTGPYRYRGHSFIHWKILIEGQCTCSRCRNGEQKRPSTYLYHFQQEQQHLPHVILLDNITNKIQFLTFRSYSPIGLQDMYPRIWHKGKNKDFGIIQPVGLNSDFSTYYLWAIAKFT